MRIVSSARCAEDRKQKRSISELPMIGQMNSSFQVLERISVGSVAEVYKAVEHRYGQSQIVAVKRILPYISDEQEFVNMLRDEAILASQLNHPNIVQIYRTGMWEDKFCIVFEYIDGKDLRSLFADCQRRQQPMPIPLACYIALKVCEGLEYAHRKADAQGQFLHLIHRDISPSNILISYQGEVKLIDFGVAKAAGRISQTQAGVLKGKFGYMSPEQIRGLPLDHRSDLFSLGICLYELLTTTRLFPTEGDFTTLEKIRNAEIRLPSSLNRQLPRELDQIVCTALAEDPKNRYTSALVFRDELAKFLNAQENTVREEQLAKWMQQMRAEEQG